MSLASIFRQVEREGRRWGLFPILRDGKVAVAEMVYELPKHQDGATVRPQKTPRVICSFDEDSAMDAFSMVLRFRAQRHHHDFMKIVMASQRKKHEAEQRIVDQRRKDLRKAIESRVIRQRLMFTPAGMSR